MDDALVPGGRAPSGFHEVRIRRVDPAKHDTAYVFYVRDTRTKEVVHEIAGSNMYGFDQILDEEAAAHWDPSSAWVAIRDRTTKHGSTLSLLRITPGSDATEIAIPDYQARALAVVGVDTIRITSHSHVTRWAGSRLHIKFTFDTHSSVGPNVFQFDVVLSVGDRDSAASLVSLVKVKEGFGGLD